LTRFSIALEACRIVLIGGGFVGWAGEARVLSLFQKKKPLSDATHHDQLRAQAKLCASGARLIVLL